MRANYHLELPYDRLTFKRLYAEIENGSNPRIREDSRGFERIQHATRELLTIADAPAELTNLKKMWGLRSVDEDDDQNASGEESNEALLQSAEDLDTELNHQLAHFTLRIEDAMQKLQQFQTLLQRQIDEKKQFEEKNRPPQAEVADATVSNEEQQAIAHPPAAAGDEPPLIAQDHVTTIHSSPEQSHHHTPLPPDSLMPASIVLLPGAIATNEQEDDDDSNNAKDE
ncbi:hypothetical protein FI667_g6319, partial [Globisporangium splendens]